MPLLSLRRFGAAGILICILASCSSTVPEPPSFSASGYIAEGGAVRIWRKDDTNRHSVNLFSVYSPFKGDDTQVTRYRFVNGEIRQITRSQTGSNSQNVEIRFDAEGNPSFIQRQRQQRREKLDNDELALYQFEARRLLDISNSLRVGQVRLAQGQWRDGVMTLCDGTISNVGFDRRATSRIVSRAGHSSAALGVAWLEAPEGTQLLLVANDNFCHWQPREDDF